jgi:hypothetical protein
LNKKDNIGGVCSTYGRDEKCIQVAVGKSDWRRLLGRTRPRCEDNVKIGIKTNTMGGCGLVSFSSGYG